MSERVASQDVYQLVIDYRRPVGCLGSQRRVFKYKADTNKSVFTEALSSGDIQLQRGERAKIIEIRAGESFSEGRFVEVGGVLVPDVAFGEKRTS